MKVELVEGDLLSQDVEVIDSAIPVRIVRFKKA